MSDIQSVDGARAAVEQLRREKDMQRTRISTTAGDLCKHVTENEKDDYLVNGFPTDKMNPYRPKNNFQCLAL